MDVNLSKRRAMVEDREAGGLLSTGWQSQDTTWQLNPADNKHMNSSSLVIREIEIKATVRAHAH